MSDDLAVPGADTVFVLGAGFTRAFLPLAPLMLDDYDGDNFLTEKFAQDKHASRLLALEKGREGGKINIERLMTRLDAGMPIDSVLAPRAELEHLLHEVHQAFFRKLEAATKKQPHAQELCAFATHCLQYGINCITFNYDDYLDWALTVAGNHPTWNWGPTIGYGFGVSPIPSGNPSIAGKTSILLVKLHGSVNWRLRLGHHSPVNPGDVVHWVNWRAGIDWTPPRPSSDLLERDSFFVPPVLTKSSIHRDPLLKFLWIKAHRILEQAKHVIFVGYSMPDTDIASRFLFTEAIRLDAKIEAVVWTKEDKEETARVERTYQKLFSRKPEVKVENVDALPWLKTFIANWKSPASAK